ncbi:MAG: BatD family protein [Sulfurimonas sp.]|nr:BatD family protein [Sulfurimonas sp.]
MNKIFKLLFLLILPHVIYAGVTAKVDYKTVELGEMVTYSLNISGEDITRPNVRRLCDTDVISTSSQTSVQIINGNITKSYTLSYKFVPQKSCTIESIAIEIGGKTELSNPVDITVKPVSAAKDKNFILTLSTDKKELSIGETFDLTLIFKQKTDSEAVDSEFTPPELKGFWVKNESKPQSYKEGKYSVTKVVYTMAAQRAGKLKIAKAQMRIASRTGRANSWGSWIPTIKWKTYFSNELNLDVKPLPSGVSLVGDFSIEAKVDKKEINVNEAVNLTIEVLGIGNLEDIKNFKPYIDGVSVFDEKIVIEGTKLTQKIAFIAERNFTIPAFNLKYFDPETKEIKTISSKEIDVKVKNAKAKEELTIKREDKKSVEAGTGSNTKFDKTVLIITFIVGLVSGILLMLLKPFKRLKKEKKSSLKEPKVLLMKLLPYKDDEEVGKIMDILEKNIYSNEKLEYDKKALKEILKKYEID